MPILNCTCKNDQQDSLHGPGRRVFNKTTKKDPPEGRCTSCGNTKALKGDAFTPSKKGKK